MDRTRTRPEAERERELDRAIEAYLAGAMIEDVSAFDFNVGQALRARGRSREAVEHLQRFLDCASAGMDPATRASVEKKIAALDPSGGIRAELERKRAAAVDAQAAVPSKPPPEAPVRLQTPSLTAPSPPGAPPGLTASADASEGVGWTRVAGLGMTGLGLAGAGITAWFAFDAQGLDKQAIEPGRKSSESRALTDRAADRRRSAVIFGIGSGVMLTTGVVLALWPRGHAPTRAAWHLGVTGSGVAVFGRY